MTAEHFEQAVAATHGVLAGVTRDQLDAPTPCAQWKVSDLVNHIVGGQHFFAAGIEGRPPSGEEVDFSAGDFLGEFDRASTASVAAFAADGAMDRNCNLPFGQMPGSVFVNIAATDTFAHGWDLAKATGQDTDLAPELAAQLLAASRQIMQPAFRSEDGAVFGPEQRAPAGASNADQLAAFLGRTV